MSFEGYSTWTSRPRRVAQHNVRQGVVPAVRDMLTPMEAAREQQRPKRDPAKKVIWMWGAALLVGLYTTFVLESFWNWLPSRAFTRQRYPIGAFTACNL